MMDDRVQSSMRDTSRHDMQWYRGSVHCDATLNYQSCLARGGVVWLRCRHTDAEAEGAGRHGFLQRGEQRKMMSSARWAMKI